MATATGSGETVGAENDKGDQLSYVESKVTCVNCLATPIFYLPAMKVFICQDCSPSNQEKEPVREFNSYENNPNEENYKYNLDFNDGFIYKASAWDDKKFKQELMLYKDKVREGSTRDLNPEMTVVFNGQEKGKYAVSFSGREGQKSLCLKNVRIHKDTDEPREVMDIAGNTICSVIVKRSVPPLVSVRVEGLSSHFGTKYTRGQPKDYLTIDLYPANDVEDFEACITLATKINTTMELADCPLPPGLINVMRPIKEGLLNVQFPHSELNQALCILDMQKLCIYNTNGSEVPNDRPFYVIFFYKHNYGTECTAAAITLLDNIFFYKHNYGTECTAAAITLLDNTIDIRIIEPSGQQHVALKPVGEESLSEGLYSWRRSFKTITPHEKSMFTNSKEFLEEFLGKPARNAVSVKADSLDRCASHWGQPLPKSSTSGGEDWYANDIDLMEVSNPTNETN
ncbi:unnamed protein product, partial [Owenia fusiformis]